jgi:hypothetical protein
VAAGYEPFLECFDNPGVGVMGYHYVNFSIVDLKLDPQKPEAMVYQPTTGGKLKLGAVEYIVPAADWDAAGNSMPPMLFGQMFHLNASLGVYVLHAWVFNKNPLGVFSDWNPCVSCNPN